MLHVKIRNFGRVESADITLNDLIVFVGNNNSGKTMIMQLIYGIRKELENFLPPVCGIKQSELNGQLLIRCDQGWYKEVELKINKYLDENKSRIIMDIFGVSIFVGQIEVELESDEAEYFVSSISGYRNIDALGQEKGINIDILQYKNGENAKSFANQVSVLDYPDGAVMKALKIVWRIILCGKNTMDSGQLFLPASRSGLQLLYKYYFAGEAAGSLVTPVKEFLRFLQLYAEDSQLNEARSVLLEFGEKYLLYGKVIQRGDETFYVDSQESREIPLHIASSMIHELTPFVKALNATQRIDWLYCDEVENSLHPLLQREMARWLIRMVNAGMHVIISSHSDTMASRLNNLFMLTQSYRKDADYKILSELELVDADLLRPDVAVCVYEFRNVKPGKTIVEKLEFISYPLMGYDFQLFGRNLDKLYDEADRITR